MPTDAPDPIDVTLPPAFPAWMRTLDPILAAEDTNPIFEAFRRRRRLHAGSRLRRVGLGAIASPSYYVGIALIVCATIVAAYACGCAALVLPPVALAVLHTRVGRERIKLSVMPPRLGSIFARRGCLEPAALDLWMTGCGGTTIAQALYLEHREHTGRWLLFTSGVVLGLVGAGLTAGLVGGGGGGWTLLVMPLYIWFAIESAIAIFVAAGKASLRNGVYVRTRSWANDSHVADEITESIMKLVAPLFVLLGLSCLSSVLFELLSGMDDERMQMHVVIAGLTLLLALVTLGIHHYREWAPAQLAATARQEFLGASFAYEAYMRAVVASDPDAARSDVAHPLNPKPPSP